jgi:Rps23 Pro-64 3,4-dihydroxylase Tpa1-like proline 4-hydroxylase
MNYKIYRDPFTFIVIENWSEHPERYYSNTVELIPLMKPSVVYGSNTQVLNTKYKSSHNLWLYNTPEGNKLAKEFEKDLWTAEFKQILFETKDSLFQSACYTDSSQVLLSRYEEDDHYAWHRDYNDTITINYLIGKEPLGFKGGDFIFGSWDDEDPQHTITFKPNTLMVFPSRIKHRVTPVTDFTGNPADARFTLQYWGKLKYVVEQ